MKILLFDIETAPMMAYTWSLYNEITSMKMVEKDWYCLCWSAKWLDNKEIFVDALPNYKNYKKNPEDDKHIMKKLWKLFDKADIIVAHNGSKFDIKSVNARFIYHGMPPPSPYKIIDTLTSARRYFNFTSNKLNDLGQFLKVGKKVLLSGFELWKGCMRGDLRSWRKMIKYCKQDVRLLEKIYIKMRPYIKNHPNISVSYIDRPNCPRCKSSRVTPSGKYKGKSHISQLYRCLDCNKCFSELIKGIKFIKPNDGRPACPDCGSDEIHKKDIQVYKTHKVQRYRCVGCSRSFSVIIEKFPEKKKVYPKCPTCGRFSVHPMGKRRTLTGINQNYQCYCCGSWSHKKIRNFTKEEKTEILKSA
jgi:transposase-like protein